MSKFKIGDEVIPASEYFQDSFPLTVVDIDENEVYSIECLNFLGQNSYWKEEELEGLDEIP